MKRAISWLPNAISPRSMVIIRAVMFSSNGSPGYFYDPGLAGLAGTKEFIVESKLLDSERVSAALYFQAKTRGMDPASLQAKDWVASQWQQIASAPYKSDAFKSLVYQNLILVAALAPEQRTDAQKKLLAAFQEYIKQRRVYLAQMGPQCMTHGKFMTTRQSRK